MHAVQVHSLQVELAQSKTSNTEKAPVLHVFQTCGKEQELLSAQAWINYYKRSWEEVWRLEWLLCVASDRPVPVLSRLRKPGLCFFAQDEMLWQDSKRQTSGAYAERTVLAPGLFGRFEGQS